MTFKVSDNQYGRSHLSDSWASCTLLVLVESLPVCSVTDFGHLGVVHLVLHCVSKKVPLCDCPYLRQILTDFQKFFTDTFCGQVAVVLL